MKNIYGSRGIGKTTYCLETAKYSKAIPVVCDKNAIMPKLQLYSLESQTITFDELIDNAHKYRGKDVVIDEILNCVKTYLNARGINVIACSYSIED